MKFQPNHTFLFVPATRLDRIPKAFAAGAAAVILDLEDSVAPDKKESVRQSVLENKSQLEGLNIYLRVNATDTPYFSADIDAAKELPVVGIILPKTESALDIHLAYAPTLKPIIPIIESARATLNLGEIASAEGVEALTYGNLDYANDTNTVPGSPSADLLFNRVRVELLLHSAANNLQAPIDSVYQNFHDDQGLTEYANRWRALGFGGMLCIHPRQVEVVCKAIAPTEEELSFARRVMEEYGKHGDAAFQLDGKMVDIPVIKRAQRILDEYKILASDEGS